MIWLRLLSVVAALWGLAACVASGDVSCGYSNGIWHCQGEAGGSDTPGL